MVKKTFFDMGLLGSFLLGFGVCGWGYHLNGIIGWIEGLFISAGIVLLILTNRRANEK
jgi:hypothetical protein